MSRPKRLLLLTILYVVLFAASFCCFSYLNGYQFLSELNLQLIIGIILLIICIVLIVILLVTMDKKEKLIETVDNVSPVEQQIDEEDYAEANELSDSSEIINDEIIDNTMLINTSSQQYKDLEELIIEKTGQSAKEDNSISETQEQSVFFNVEQTADDTSVITDDYKDITQPTLVDSLKERLDEIDEITQEFTPQKQDEDVVIEEEIPEPQAIRNDRIVFSVDTDEDNELIDVNEAVEEKQEKPADPDHLPAAEPAELEGLLSDTQINYINNSANSYLDEQGNPQLVVTNEYNKKKIVNKEASMGTTTMVNLNKDMVNEMAKKAAVKEASEEDFDDLYEHNGRADKLDRFLTGVIVVLIFALIALGGYYMYSRYLG